MTFTPPPLGSDGRWHYRRSLASRVTLLTTMAVGLAVTLVALGAFLTVRMQLQSSPRDSLVQRAKNTSAAIEQADALTQAGATVLYPASDVRLGSIRSDGQVTFVDQGDVIHLGDQELAVATGDSKMSVRTIRAGGTDYRVVAVPIPARPGFALVVAQSLTPTQHLLAKLGLVTLLFGLAGMVAAGLAGWGVARNGLRPVRRLT